MVVPRWLASALLIAVLLAGIVLAARSLLGAGHGQALAWNGMVAEPALRVPATALTDQRGETVRLTDHQGRIVLVFFGYTNCPDVCPLSLQTMAQVRRLLGSDAEQVRFYLVTVDPERDTPERLAAYLRLIDPTFGGLTGEPVALAEVYAAFGVRAQKESYSESTAGYSVAHTSLIYAIDRSGRIRLAYPMGLGAEQIAADIRRLAREMATPR